MPSLILISLWNIGASVVIFLAGLQDVPRSLYEAAEIDGAGPLSLIRHVTIPMISPVILFNLVIGMIGAFQIFAPPFIIFGAGTQGNGGGPLNSVLMYSVQLFTQAFKYFNMGYAAAMASPPVMRCSMRSSGRPKAPSSTRFWTTPPASSMPGGSSSRRATAWPASSARSRLP